MANDPEMLINPVPDIVTLALRDVQTIVDRAAKNNHNESELSGHDLLTAINDTWRKLDTTISNIWG